MEKIKIIESEEKISNDDLINFQNTYKINIPKNLNTLLLKHNGGITTNSNFFSQLFSIKYGQLTFDEIINYNQILEKNISKEYLPFAITSVGHFLTIKVANDNIGKIFLFRHDEFIPILLSKSLEELLGVKNIDEV
jgi:SMI1 / KNR4 family (SUKH-1)